MAVASSKQFGLSGIGNALVDVFVDVSEAEFTPFGFERATMRLVSAEEQLTLFKALGDKPLRQVSGGSVANSMIAFAQLGGRGAFLTSIGADALGSFYKKEFESFGISFPTQPTSSGAPTGTCVALITPDAERTMRTCLGATQELGNRHLHEGTIAASEWLFIEGYTLSNPGGGQEIAESAIALAKKHGTKIALTCSEAWVVQGFRPLVDQILASADMVICNETESQALTGKSSGAEAFADLIGKFSSVVVTQGEKGALVRWQGGSPATIPAVACTPRDLTGAGDMFAGAFFAGVLNGKSSADAGARAAQLASKVISQVGARLERM